jgi:hypothetical protein
VKAPRLSPLFFGLALASACSDDLEPASLLDRPRVVGAHVQVVEAPTRSSPHAGEHVLVDFYTASHDVARGAYSTYALLVCPSDANNHSTTSCVGPQAGVFTGTDMQDPAITLAAPAPSGEVMLFGIFCTSGVASLSTDAGESRGSCDGGSGQEVSVRVAIAEDNLEPILTGAALTFDGAPFPSDAPCEAGAPTIPADGATHQIGFRTDQLGTEPADAPVMMHLGTHGKLDRLYTEVQPGADAQVSWKAPSDLGSPRESARFHFVLRDGRGGTAFLIRTICLQKGA